MIDLVMLVFDLVMIVINLVMKVVDFMMIMINLVMIVVDFMMKMTVNPDTSKQTFYEGIIMKESKDKNF